MRRSAWIATPSTELPIRRAARVAHRSRVSDRAWPSRSHSVIVRRPDSIRAGKECGLALSIIAKEIETATEIYECPLGHRTYVSLAPREPPRICRESVNRHIWYRPMLELSAAGFL